MARQECQEVIYFAYSKKLFLATYRRRRDQLAPAPYRLPRLARQEGCNDMSIDCLSNYHGRVSRDVLRAWSGWASPVIHGPRHEPGHGQRYYKPDHGPRYELGRQLELRHLAAGSLGQQAADADTYGWTWRPRASLQPE